MYNNKPMALYDEEVQKIIFREKCISYGLTILNILIVIYCIYLVCNLPVK